MRKKGYEGIENHNRVRFKFLNQTRMSKNQKLYEMKEIEVEVDAKDIT